MNTVSRGALVGVAFGVAALFLAVVTAVVGSASSGQALDPPESTRPPQRATRPALDPAHPRRLTDAVSLYPRVIRLAHAGSANGHIIAGVVSNSDRSGVAEFFESKDGGVTFAPLSTISDVTAADGRGLCCGTLFEVPRPIGRTPEGALLWAASTGQSDTPNRRMAIRVWRSLDHGHTWSYLSSCATASDRRGLWEPELSADAAGRLVCHFSDETQPRHSQVLARVASSDGGLTWGPRTDTVVAAQPTYRPGMAVVRQLPYGVYVMSYEICAPGTRHMCPVHFRTSTDGWNWGDPADPGPRAQTADNAYFEHAPTLTWTSGVGLYGRLIMVGQLVTAGDGSTSAGSGRTILFNDQRGSGPWHTAAAPVPMKPSPYDTCSNYSSALLPSDNGSSLLEIATRADSDGVCRAYFATAPLRPSQG